MKIYVIIISTFFTTLSFFSAQDLKLSSDEMFGALKARQIGPALMSGRISDLELHPTNNRIIYAGTAGGGVWKSSNGGSVFISIFDDYPQSIGVVKLNPHNPDNEIWVGTGETWTRNSVSVGKGLFKSIDGGANWNEIKGFENSERISSIVFNPNNKNEIFVGVLGALWGNSEERGIYKSSDGGKTWDKTFYIDEKTGSSDLIRDPNNPSIMYASFWEFRRTPWSFSSGGENSALYKSIDGGNSWNKIHKGFPKGKLGRFAFAIAPSNSNILYAAVESEKDEDKGLYKSKDAGKSWTHLNKDFGLVVRPFYFSRLTVDPKNPDVVVKAGLRGSISRDGGETFKNLGSMHADIHDIVFDKISSDVMFVGTDGGVYRTWDGGITMEIVNNIPVSQFYHISIDNDDPYNIYGGLQDNGSWYGPSDSPGGIEASDWKRVGYGDGFRVLRHPTNKNVIYSEMQGAKNVWRFNKEKNQVKIIKPYPVSEDEKLRFNWNAPIAVSANNSDRLYIGSQFLHKSNDMGDTWEKISPDLTTNDSVKLNQENSGGLSKDNSGAENHCTIFTIAESSLDEKVIWVGTDDGNIQVTKNGGRKWENVTPNILELPKHSWVYHLEASVFDKGTVYAVFDRHTLNDGKTYVYKTSDYGKTWRSITTNQITGFARNIQEDLENPNILYLGTEFGLYITIDGGKNWNKFENNMPATAVHFIAMDKKTNDLVIGTHGRGIIIIDDVSPLRELNSETFKNTLTFVGNDDFIINEESGFGGNSTESQFIGLNPSKNAKIMYVLNKRHTFGKMKMYIEDSKGNKIKDLDPGKKKGLNIVEWNFKKRQPKIPKGRTFIYGAFGAPNVSAGLYKVVIEKGKDKYEKTINIGYPENSLYSLEEREVQQNTVGELYNMTEGLAYIVYQVDEYTNFFENNKTLDENNLQKSINQLNVLKETLTVTTGDNYVGTAEPQLREKLVSLYGNVQGYAGKPSNAQLESLKNIKKRFNDAKKAFETLNSNAIANSLKSLEEKGKTIKIKTFEEFIEN